MRIVTLPLCLTSKEYAVLIPSHLSATEPVLQTKLQMLENMLLGGYQTVSTTSEIHFSQVGCIEVYQCVFWVGTCNFFLFSEGGTQSNEVSDSAWTIFLISSNERVKSLNVLLWQFCMTPEKRRRVFFCLIFFY